MEVLPEAILFMRRRAATPFRRGSHHQRRVAVNTYLAIDGHSGAEA
jgi:hypothetical protein